MRETERNALTTDVHGCTRIFPTEANRENGGVKRDAWERWTLADMRILWGSRGPSATRLYVISDGGGGVSPGSPTFFANTDSKKMQF